MDIQELESADTLHHAYVVTGSAEKGSARVTAMLATRGVAVVGNPDLLSLSYPELLVDDVRDTILPFASLKPLGERKYVIVAFSRANANAQNALLKAVEEAGSTVFFFCVDSIGHMLPTLRSRAIAVMLPRGTEVHEEAEEFAAATFDMRLSAVEKMASAASKSQDRTPVRSFVRGLINAFKADAPAAALRDLLDADQYMRMQGSSVKAVLGHLAVTLPRKKK